MTNLLTIAIPAHNKSSYLNSALNSIIRDDQFGENINLVISDNSLNDDIKNLYYESFSYHKDIHYFKSKDFPCLDSNVNRSVEVSSGKYVWIFGDDDVIVPGVLKKLISFLKEEKPCFTVLNSKSFRDQIIVEESRLPNNIQSVYDNHDNDKFLSDMAGYLTYVGGICVLKDLWLQNYDKSKIGSFFAHIKCLASIKIGRKAHYFKYPAIQMRIGSQTWSEKSFLIWHKYYPEIIWGLDNYSEDAKNNVICRNPMNSIKTMLASRAYGRIDFKIFKNLILRSKKVNLERKIFILFLLIIPKIIFQKLYIIYILIFKNEHNINFSPKLALNNLRPHN